jgi:hypothetical protein
MEYPGRLDRLQRRCHAVKSMEADFVNGDLIPDRVDAPRRKTLSHEQMRIVPVGDETSHEIRPDKAGAARNDDDPFHPSCRRNGW